jgi:hypothetical protein
MATKNDNLTPAALAAVDLLATGATVTATAKATGTSRQTVSDWLNNNPAFKAALNQRRAELWGQTCDRMRALLPLALDRIEAALQSDGIVSLNAALALVRMAKLDPLPTGPVEREAVEVEQAERARDIERRSFFAA